MNIPITNLAELKRAIVTPGVRIRFVDHWQERLKNTVSVSVRIQRYGHWFMGPDYKGAIVEMWAPTPKASELQFNVDGSVTFHPNTTQSRTLLSEIESHMLGLSWQGGSPFQA
jgi:hypothetical protein